MIRKWMFFIVIFFIFTSIVNANNFDERLFFENEINKAAILFKREIHFKKAYFYFQNKNWDSTLVYSMKQLNASNNDIQLNNFTHYIRGTSFLNKGLFSESKSEFKAISNDFPFQYKIKIANGIIALKQNKYTEAIAYFDAVEKDISCHHDIDKSSFYHNLGLCYFHTKQFDKAEKYLIKSSDLHSAEKDTTQIISSYMDLANLYYEQYKDDQAIPYFEKAYQLSKKVNSFELKQNAAENMAVVEENRKNLPKALAYRKEMEQWKDSLNDQNKVWAIAQLEKKHAVQQKQKEITLLEAENKIKIAERNGLFYSSISLLLLLGTSIYFFQQKVKRNKIILTQKEELDELNATKDKLFSIVSHDLRSSVNALKTSNVKLMATLESKNYAELDQLLHTNSSIANSSYNLLDNLLNWALLQTKQLYFHQESQHLFSVIQQIEFNYKPLFLDKKIAFSNTVSKDVFVFVDLDSFKIILRNLLDNAIKFSKSEGKISIYTEDSEDGFCHLIVEDTGIGMSNTIQEELLKESVLLSKKGNSEIMGSGLGTHLCKSMIAKNGGKLSIKSQENIGTKICVSLLKSEHHG
jgi:signal transduction histidine kinase